MAKKASKKEETLNLEAILFKCRDILRQAKNSGSFFEKRDMMLTLVFLRFMGEKYEDGVAKLRQKLIEEGLDPDDEEIIKAFFDDATFADGTFDLPIEARWSTIINTAAPQLNVALDTALRSIGETNPQLKGCFVEGTFTQRNLGANDMKKIVDEINKISHKAFGEGIAVLAGDLLLNKAADPDKTYIEKVLPDKMKYNLEMIRNFSLLQEVGILLQTLKAIVR